VLIKWCEQYKCLSDVFDLKQRYQCMVKVEVKVKQSLTGLDRPWWFQEVETPRFQDNRHMKVVRLPPGNTPGTHFC